MGSIFDTYSAEDLNAKIVTFKVFIDNVERKLKNPIVLINNKTYVSLSEISELFGNDIEWDSNYKKILINTNQNNDCDENNGKNLLYPYEEDGMWGYKDKDGNVIVYPEYYEANEFSNGLGLVMTSKGQDGNYGYINNKGEIAIPCIYPYAENFSDGAALVNLSNSTDIDMWRYIDCDGNYLFNKTVELPHSFHNGYAVVLKEGNSYPTPANKNITKKWSYINKNGEFATEMIFEEAGDFCNGIAPVKNNGKWGVIDNKFNIIVDYKYEDIKILPNEKNVINALKDNTWIKINVTEN